MRTVAMIVLGAGLFIGGVWSLVKRRTRAGAELEQNRDYSGMDAVLLGLLWILLGAVLLYAGLAPRNWPAVQEIDALAKMILDA